MMPFSRVTIASANNDYDGLQISLKSSVLMGWNISDIQWGIQAMAWPDIFSSIEGQKCTAIIINQGL